MSIKVDVIVIGIAGVALYFGARYAKQQAAQIVKDVKPYVDPTDSRNVAYSGVNAIGAAITGDSSWSLGTKLFDWWNPNQVEQLPAPYKMDENNINNPLSWD